jgi:hypothetical protein
MAGHNSNAKSTTYSTRVPLWLDEEVQKKKIDPEETNSAVVIRALIAFVTGETNG